MFLTVHAAAAAAVGQFIDSPPLAFLAGFASHFVLDTIPHGDESIRHWRAFKTPRQRIAAAALIDFSILLVMTILWLSRSPVANFPSMVYAMAGSILPDALWGLHELTQTPLLSWYERSHGAVHRLLTKKQITMRQGFLIQVPLLILLTWLIVR